MEFQSAPGTGNNSGTKNLSRFFGEFIRRTENTDETVLEPEKNPETTGEASQKTGGAISFSQLEETLLTNRQQLSQRPAEASVVMETLETDIADYKPLATSKQNVYTINEMLSLSKEMPKEIIETISSMLPKKKFWRLYQKHPEPRGASSKGRGQDGVYDKKLKNIKGSKPGSNKRFHNKFGRVDKGSYIEENDINANNDDLIALEEEIGSSPNSMMDFEAWKAKMKDMERKKKGLAPLSDPGVNPNKEISSKSSPSANFSSTLGNGTNSISEFLNMTNTKASSETNEVSLQSNSTDKSSTVAVQEEGITIESKNVHSEQTDEEKKAGSSRFSSFFSNTSKETKNATVNNHSGKGSPESADLGYDNKNDANNSEVSGSRLMSFFPSAEKEKPRANQESNKTVNNEHPLLKSQNSDNSGRSYVSRDPRISMDGSVGGTPISLPVKLEHQGPLQHPQAPPQFNRMHSDQLPQGQRQMPPGMMFPPNPQNNSAFFQGLLTKGKPNEQGSSVGPAHSLPQGNNGRPNEQKLPPMRMPPPGLPMGIPPPNMMPPPGMSGFPINMPRGQIPPHLDRESERKDVTSHQGNSSNMNGPSFIPGMGPPPPGFPPLPNIPMGFPNGQFAPNMGPPMNGSNYGKVPMPMPQQNMRNFPNQPSQNMNPVDKK